MTDPPLWPQGPAGGPPSPGPGGQQGPPVWPTAGWGAPPGWAATPPGPAAPGTPPGFGGPLRPPPGPGRPGPSKGLLAAIGLGAVLVVAGGAAVVVAATGSGQGSGPQATTTTPTTKVAAPGQGAGVGDAHDLNFEVAGVSGREQVTLDKVIDPARTVGAPAPATGQRAVGIELTMTDLGPGPLLDDLASDVTATATNGRTYHPGQGGAQGCPSLLGGSYQLVAGGSATGCATFVLPEGAKVARVVFAPLGGVTGSAPGQWQLRP